MQFLIVIWFSSKMKLLLEQSAFFSPSLLQKSLLNSNILKLFLFLINHNTFLISVNEFNRCLQIIMYMKYVYKPSNRLFHTWAIAWTSESCDHTKFLLSSTSDLHSNTLQSKSISIACLSSAASFWIVHSLGCVSAKISSNRSLFSLEFR